MVAVAAVLALKNAVPPPVLLKVAAPAELLLKNCINPGVGAGDRNVTAVDDTSAKESQSVRTEI
jgi:hypothetical protein